MYSYSNTAKTLTYNSSFGAPSASGNTIFNARQIQWAVRFQF
jgi:hypothetical protein